MFSATMDIKKLETEKTETEPFVQNGTINICIPSVRLNKEVIDMALKASLALNCKINQ